MTKAILRILAATVAVVSLGTWLATGANGGWTKTSVAVKETDEITGITVDKYEKRFVPGVELLGAALVGAGILAGASFLFGTKQPQPDQAAIQH